MPAKLPHYLILSRHGIYYLRNGREQARSTRAIQQLLVPQRMSSAPQCSQDMHFGK